MKNITNKNFNKIAKLNIAKLASLGIASTAIVACGPPLVEVVDEIKTNETAFLVPLEEGKGETQEKFMSLEYLESAKVPAKRVTIPQRKTKTGRFYFNYKWIPTVRVIKVDRSPITREWTGSTGTGTSAKDQAIKVESKDSIGFSVGVNITAAVHEDDAARFLYYYAGRSLAEIVDENVRGYMTSIIAREFGELSLTECKIEKGRIFTEAAEELKTYFSEFGITIKNLGHSEGLIYDDREIQTAINRANVAEMDISIAEQEAKAATKRNEMMVAKAKAEREAAEEFQKAQEAIIARTELEIEMMRAEAYNTAAEKWGGSVPSNILPEGSSLLFGLDTKADTQRPMRPAAAKAESQN